MVSLTKISGVGKKTAEKLQEQGIETANEAIDALERGDEAIANASTRVRSGIREYALEERGEVFDGVANVTVTPENRRAVETFSSQSTGSLNDAGRITRNNESLRGSLLDLGRSAGSGELLTETRLTPTQQEISETIVSPRPSKTPNRAVEDREDLERQQARRNIVDMGFDVAANVSDLDRETIKEANERAEAAGGRGRRDPKTGFTRTVTREVVDEEKEFEEDVRANARELAAAKRVHAARSPEAKRVDNQRKAPVTGNFDEWIEDPSETDFPNVDTPERGAAAGSKFGFSGGDETELEARVDLTPAGEENTFEVRETEADGGGFGQISRGAGEILSAPDEQQQVILSDLIPGQEQQEEIGLEPRGPDEEFFEFNDPLVNPDRGGGGF